MDREKLVKFSKSSASGSRSRNFLKDSSTLPDRAVFHTWLISLEKTARMLTKIFTRAVPLDKEIPLNIGSHADPYSGSGLRIGNGSALVEVCALQVLLFLMHRQLKHILFFIAFTLSALYRLNLVVVVALHIIV